MASARFDCDCDKVIEMEAMGIGPEEILQYAHALLPREALRNLVRGLEEILASTGEATEDAAAACVESRRTPGC